MDPSHTPHSLYPVRFPPPQAMDAAQPRTFFPYIPNEVKHRKRTSRHQLKVLEDVFRKDTKPNAVLRKKLAADLEMSPRAVQVWFQNRRAKEKALRKRVAANADQDKPASSSTKKPSPSRDASPNDSSNSSTATEKPMLHLDDDDDLASGPSTTAPTTSPVLKLSCSPPLLPCSPPPPWPAPSAAPVDVPPHVRPPPVLDANAPDPDLYSTRRPSLPTVMPSQPLPPHLPQPAIHYPDRRKSMDVNFFRLMHHPFARIAKEKNEALYLPKSPLSPAGSTPAHLARPSGLVSGVGPIRTNGHAYRPTLSHRASEPHVFAAARTPFLPVPESAPVQALPPARRFSDNRLYAITSRTVSSPIPGPLPTPDFQFGDPSSGSPSNASPTPGEVEAQSPPVPLQSPEMAQLQRWSFPPRSRETDQDTEDSCSYSASSTRYGSVTSISGSDSSAMYSDVSSCVAVDHVGYDASARRGSCASGSFLEMRLSGLNVSSRSSQGSLNEAHMNAAAALAYRDKLAQQERPSDAIGGYVSPASTATPGTSPHMQQAKESAPPALRNDGVYDFSPLSQVPENDEIVAARRGSLPQEPVPHIYVQNHLEPPPEPYATPSSETRAPSVQPAVQQQHYAQSGGFIPPSGFTHSAEPSLQPDASAYPTPQASQLPYASEGAFQGAPNTMNIPHAGMSRYAPPSHEYTYAPGHRQEPFVSLS